jgi:hypothetical protein
MELFLSGERDLLPVFDAIELIARHILDRDEQPVLGDDGDGQVNIQLVTKERLWAGRVRAAAVSGMLRLYDAEGYASSSLPEQLAVLTTARDQALATA